MREQCAIPIVLLSTHGHSSYFFKSTDNAMNDGFQYPCTLHYHPTTSTTVILQNSYHPSDVFIVPSFPLHSAFSINFSPTVNWLRHQNTVARDTDESPNASTNIAHIFATVNPTLQDFIAACCSKFFSIVIYNPRYQTYDIAKRSYNGAYRLVCRWRRV